MTGDAATEGRSLAPPLPRGDANCNPSDIGFWRLIREDFRTNGSDIGSQGFWALAIHRYGNWRMSIRWWPLRLPFSIAYRILNKLCQMLCGIQLDYTVQVGRRVRLEHFGGMILVARRIGNDVVIRQNTTFGIKSLSDLNAKPVIEDNVSIGAGAVIVGDVVIGHDSLIGANAVVACDVPPYSKAIGNPCVITPRQDVGPEGSRR